MIAEDACRLKWRQAKGSDYRDGSGHQRPDFKSKLCQLGDLLAVVSRFGASGFPFGKWECH